MLFTSLLVGSCDWQHGMILSPPGSYCWLVGKATTHPWDVSYLGLSLTCSLTCPVGWGRTHCGRVTTGHPVPLAIRNNPGFCCSRQQATREPRVSHSCMLTIQHNVVFMVPNTHQHVIFCMDQLSPYQANSMPSKQYDYCFIIIIIIIIRVYLYLKSACLSVSWKRKRKKKRFSFRCTLNKIWIQMCAHSKVW